MNIFNTSLSPNQVVAILLSELTKNGCPIAIIDVEATTVAKFPFTSTNSLNQAPAIVNNEPSIN